MAGENKSYEIKKFISFIHSGWRYELLGGRLKVENFPVLWFSGDGRKMEVESDERERVKFCK